MKKHIIFTMLFALVSTIATAQIFNPHKRALNRAEEKAADLLKGGADFVLDPIEQVPSERTLRNVSPLSQTNWGATLLLTPALRQRLVDECTFKVIVKVADTGHPDHAALRQGQLPGKNYTTDADMNDGNGHSTHVAGIIASDQLGLCDALVDKGLLKHKAIKILSNQGSGSFDWVRVAVAAERAEDQAALARGEFVVWNGSFGGGTGLVQSVEAELQKSTDAGVVFLFAAGNTGGAGVNYPGNGKYSIACASLDQALTRSYYSTQGPEVWAAMPGRGINSTYKGQTWATLSGTSMATPFLTAAVAIAYSKWGPKLGKIEKVRAYLAWCSKDIVPAGKDNDTGWGMALIQNILDRDPTQTPGLPDNPPPPPPPPGDGLKSITPLPVTLKGTFNVLWDNLAPSATSAEAKTFKTAGRGSRAANQRIALKTAKVQFEISVPSTESAGATAQKLETAVDAYFKNRGFLILPTQDESWAAYWAAYFLEMGLQTGPLKWPINVNRVTLETSQGQKVPITNLRHFPK